MNIVTIAIYHHLAHIRIIMNNMKRTLKGGESMHYETSITIKMDRWLPNNFNRKNKIKKI